MNVLNTLLSYRKSYKPLDPLSSAGKSVAEHIVSLNTLAEEFGNVIEVIPDDHEAYVFVGNPYRKLDLAWVHDHEIERLDDMLQQYNFSLVEIEKVKAELRASYSHHDKDDRYVVESDSHSMLVLPSNSMKLDMHDILKRVIHH